MHRFDMDEKYAYISTEMEGYVGNILVIYDLQNPSRPEEVSRWWMPRQHIAGGEKPTWVGRKHRLHHALRFGDELWAGLWHGGVAVIDISDIRRPRTLGRYNYHRAARSSTARGSRAACASPAAGRVAPQTNDVDVDPRDLVYIVDRYAGFDILEFSRP